MLAKTETTKNLSQAFSITLTRTFCDLYDVILVVNFGRHKIQLHMGLLTFVTCNHVTFFLTKRVLFIAGFHCHTIIKAIQLIKSRIKETKRDEYSNSLAKIQVSEMFRAGDIQRKVLLRFIRLCMETSCLCPTEGHKYGCRKLTKT